MKSAFTQIVPSSSSHSLNSPYRIISSLLSYLINAHDGSPEPSAQAVKLCPEGLQIPSLQRRLGRAELAAEQGGEGVDDHEPHHAPSQQQGQPPRDALLEGVLPHTHSDTGQRALLGHQQSELQQSPLQHELKEFPIVKAACGSLSLASNHIRWFY